MFHSLASEYGTRALTYITTQNGRMDIGGTSRGLEIIQNTHHTVDELYKLGMQQGQILDPHLWTVSRAAVTVLTWSFVELGTKRTEDLLAAITV